MKELSFQDCIPLIEALQNGVRTIGILKAVNEFGYLDSKEAVNLCAKSISKNMLDGMDIQTSIRNAIPQLPNILIRILESSTLNSTLDYALDDVLLALRDHQPTQEIINNLILLAQKYEGMSASQICTGCFEQDFNKLLARAKTENASEVILEQDGESFLHQKFISAKLIHIIEPTHSLVYKTFWEKLHSACKDDGHLAISERVFRVTQKNLTSFLLTANNEDILKIVFKEQENSTEQTNRSDLQGNRQV